MKYVGTYHGVDGDVTVTLNGAQELEDFILKHGEMITSLRSVSIEHHVQVLDHGYVKLVDWMGDDLRPLRSARMSTSNETGVDEKKDDGLRNYLWGNKHVSPFQSCIASFELQVPLFVLRQIDRHRTVNVSEMKMEVIDDYGEFRQFSDRNEFSARYSELPDLFYVPELERFKAKGTINKQGSEGDLPAEAKEKAQAIVKEAYTNARVAYEMLLQLGVAAELARIVVPPGQYTKIQLQASMLNWFNFLKLRLDKHAQEETRLFAEAIAAGLKKLWPKCYEVFEEHTLNGVQLSAFERDFLATVLPPGLLVDGPGVDRRVEAALRKIRGW
jgi:thymidylate synthase (FAD)